MREGRFEAAAASYQNALHLAPADPITWSGIAELNFAARRPEDALAAWDKVLAPRPGMSAALCGKARVARSLGRVDETERWLRQALVDEPGLAPARYALALLLLEAGRLNEAESLAEQLQEETPRSIDVLHLAARLALSRGRLEPASAALQQLLTIPELPPLQRAAVLLQLGTVLGDFGQIAEAFDAAVAGERIEHAIYAERAASREDEVAKLRRLAAWFSHADRAT